MEQSDLERRLVRCRYLITRGAVERLGLRDLGAIEENEDSFIRECHSVYKRAQGILTASILEIEAEIERLSREDKKSPLLKRYEYWLRILESSYESFLWLRFGLSDILEIYKGPKHGRLTAQNVESVLAVVRHHNQDPYAFAIPLDFTRFSCISDLLLLQRRPDQNQTVFVEVKQGPVNEAMFSAIKSKNEALAFEFFDRYGEKGIEQAERFIRQMEVSMERNQLIGVRSGTFKRGKGTRIIVESKATPQHFTAEVEDLCQKARRGEYAAEIFEHCLMVAALDTTSEKRYALAEFDARLLVLNAFIASDDTAKYEPDHLVRELKKIDFINWLEGLNSISFIPPLMRPLSTRSFLDLLFGRVQLLCYFHAPGFLQLCRDAGLKAGFLSKKWTNRLRSVQGWRTGDHPIFEGRAIGYLLGNHPMVMGSLRLHEMAFNWMRPCSVVQEMVNAAFQMKDSDATPTDVSKGKSGFTEWDLEY